MDNIITKKQFKFLMKSIQKQDKKKRKLENFLGDYVDSYIIFNRDISDDIIDFLEDYFSGGDDYISWWLYEDVEKKIWENGTENEPTDVSTLDKLYDFLIRLKKENENGEKNI